MHSALVKCISRFFVIPLVPLMLLGCGAGGGEEGGDGGAASYAIGGTVTGLTDTLSLQNNGSDSLSVSANGSFAFPAKLQAGATYNVTVSTQPTGQICGVNNSSGTTGSSDITSVSVVCSAQNVAAFFIGNSLTFDVNMRGIVSLMESQGYAFILSYHVQPSKPLSYIVDNPHPTDPGIAADHLFCDPCCHPSCSCLSIFSFGCRAPHY